MDENNKGTVVAEKYLAPAEYSSLGFSFFGTTLLIFCLQLDSENFHIVPFIIVVALTIWFVVILCKMIAHQTRPTAAIKDFGDRFTVYYAFGKTRTFEYTDIDDFMAVRCVAISRRNSIVQSYGNLVIRVKKRKYLTGIIGDVESVRRTLNMIRPYKQKNNNNSN